MSIKMNSLKTLFLATVFLVFMSGALFICHSTAFAKVFYTTLKGNINDSLVRDFKGVLKEAEEMNAEALIIEIDTFGGRLNSAVELKNMLIETELNSIAFVHTKAISAGALIALASKHIVMAPGSTIGAATPVKLSYWEEKPAGEKTVSYFRKEMKSTAEARNHPGKIAEAMVDPFVKIDGLIEEGKLLTLTTKEALDLSVAEFEAQNLDALCKQYHIQSSDLEKRPIPWSEKIDDLTSETKKSFTPTLIWFLAGLVLALLEFAIPGVILIFFGVGAWIVSLTTYLNLTNSLDSQLLGFIIASILLLLFLRKWIKGRFYGHVSDVQDLSKNIDEFTGKSVVVLKDIRPRKLGGLVEFKGSTWKAISEENIKKGEDAIITGIDGITLKIKKEREE